jgi:hypothetical protein
MSQKKQNILTIGRKGARTAHSHKQQKLPVLSPNNKFPKQGKKKNIKFFHSDMKTLATD